MLFQFVGVIGRGPSLGLGGGLLERPFRRISFSSDVVDEIVCLIERIEAEAGKT
jgi:hypothetical protein